jgi:hypothetical protein
VNPVVLFLIVAGVVGVAMIMRSSGPKDEDGEAAPEREPSGASVLDEDDADEDEDHANTRVPITAEGVAFLPDGHELRLLSLVESEDVPEWVNSALESSSVPYTVLNKLYMPTVARRAAGVKPGIPLSAGDFTAARIRPGVAGEYAWRLETLGRDGDFGFFPFAERSGAEAALELIEKHKILSQTLDDDGDPVAHSNEDFEEARRRYEETESHLAIDADEEHDEGPGEWSDRR